MFNLAAVSPILPTIKAMTAANDHDGARQLIANAIEDHTLGGALATLAVLSGPDMPRLNLRALRESLYRTTMDRARACMTADAFDAVYMAL